MLFLVNLLFEYFFELHYFFEYFFLVLLLLLSPFFEYFFRLSVQWNIYASVPLPEVPDGNTGPTVATNRQPDRSTWKLCQAGELEGKSSQTIGHRIVQMPGSALSPDIGRTRERLYYWGIVEEKYCIRKTTQPLDVR